MKKITLTFEITDEMGLKAIEAEYVSPEIEYSSKLLKALLVAGLKSLNNNPEACMVADLLWEQNIAVKKMILPYQYIELACKVSRTTPRQVTEKYNYSANVNVRALIVYTLTKYTRMHPVLIGELLDRPVSDIRGILKRINSIDRKHDILSPENVKLFDMIDEIENITLQ